MKLQLGSDSEKNSNTMVNQEQHQSWAVTCGPIMLTWCRRQYQLKQRPDTSSSMNNNQFVDEVVKSHNLCRQRHQTPPLKHSQALSDVAQKWANELAKISVLKHSGAVYNGQRLGENIAMKWSSSPDAYTGKEVTAQWYSELKMYDYKRPSPSGTGHFTQVVWKGSSEIGIGKAQTSDGKVFVVANYRPAGNMLGQFEKNVFPPSDGQTSPFTKLTDSDPNSNYSQFTETPSFKNDDYLKSMSSIRTTGGQSRSVRTYTTTEGYGPNAVTKTVVEETITMPDGRKVTTKKETAKNGNISSSSRSMPEGFGEFDKDFTNRFEQMGFGNNRGLSNRTPASIGQSKSSDGGQRQGSPQTMSEFREQCLKSHNNYRVKHRVSALRHSDELTSYAQKWAEKIAASGSFQHSDCTLGNGDRLGENIACKWSSSGDDYSGQAVTEQWYTEIKKMDFSKPGMSSGTGHFTQVVWKGSRELGVGKARGRDGKVFVVASYRPAGNMMGDFHQNVFPPQ